VAVLVALLVAALWYYVAIWRATPSMPVYGNIIVDVAVVSALVAGCGLTALMYYNQCKARARTNSAQRQDAAGVSEVMTMR
jgi:hypothetical protein